MLNRCICRRFVVLALAPLYNNRALVSNLALRLWTDFGDSLILAKRRCLYGIWSCISKYDDVGPDDPSVEDPYCDQSDLGKDLEGYPWYLNVDRKTAQDLVMTGGTGCFLVRKSTRYPLTLTVAHQNRPYNIPIRKREDNKIALGTRKQNERTFNTVEELVSHYGKEELILYSGGERTGTVPLSCIPTKSEIDKRCKPAYHHVLVHVPQ